MRTDTWQKMTREEQILHLEGCLRDACQAVITDPSLVALGRLMELAIQYRFYRVISTLVNEHTPTVAMMRRELTRDLLGDRIKQHDRDHLDMIRQPPLVLTRGRQ